MSERFVILHHTGVTADHFDLMLEGPDHLWTWACEANPMDLDEGEHAPAHQQLDHRKHYLHHEGLVSGGRGRVKRVAEGTYRLLGRDEGLWRVQLQITNMGHVVTLHVGQTHVKRG